MELYWSTSSTSQGILMPIGGAEDRKANRLILRHFVELAVHVCGKSFPFKIISSLKVLLSQLQGRRYFMTCCTE